ncbi:hypothetical protein [Rhodopseudomonas sp. RCAM05734]|uniref:hypothetical protein n=1 Tax=Rhodopseudomonas sp. RCAM05734 TaxID=3457549 RepID=UPI0040443C49
MFARFKDFTIFIEIDFYKEEQPVHTKHSRHEEAQQAVRDDELQDMLDDYD